jgi:magnesium chelatase subunit I
VARVSDLFAAGSAVAGKVELVFEGEKQGPEAVAERLIGQGVAAVFQRLFPAPYAKSVPKGAKGRREQAEPEDVYKPVVDWFASGKSVVVQDERDDDGALRSVPTLEALARRHAGPLDEAEVAVACELVLEGLHQASLLSKERADGGVTYGDMLKRMFAAFEE